jgi:hypothetical protein
MPTVPLRDHLKGDTGEEAVVAEWQSAQELAYIVPGADVPPSPSASSVLAHDGVHGLHGWMDTSDLVPTAAKPAKLEGFTASTTQDESRMPANVFDPSGGPHACNLAWCAGNRDSPAVDTGHFGSRGCCSEFAIQYTQGLELDAFLLFQVCNVRCIRRAHLYHTAPTVATPTVSQVLTVAAPTVSHSTNCRCSYSIASY